MSQLEEIEAIKQLKYRYFRHLDRKEWPQLGDTLADDAISAYDQGKYNFEGRAAILAFLEEALGNPSIVSRHHGHHPEIELTSETTAVGTWYLEDYVIFGDAGISLSGAAFYDDEYVKVGGQWKIARTGYQRTYEQTEKRDGVQSLKTMFSA